MKRDFGFLRFIITLLLIFGWVSLAGGIFSFTVIMFFANPDLVVTAATLSEAITPAAWGLLAFILFCSLAGFLKVLLAIEENTRKT